MSEAISRGPCRAAASTSTNCWRSSTSTRVDDDTFIGRIRAKNPVRTFGGQMMAQAFVAASRTCRTTCRRARCRCTSSPAAIRRKTSNSTSSRLRDERRFANRRVDVMQDGLLLGTALVSHLSGGRGLEHDVDAPQCPAPHDLPTIDELLRGYEETVPHFVNALRPIEWRYTNDPAWVMRDKGGASSTHNRVWMKAEGPMPDDPVLHAAALVYSSDTTVLDSIITTHGLSWGFDRIFAVSMNHSVWFHRPVAIRRLGALLDVVAGGRGFTGPGHRAFLRRSRSDRWRPSCRKASSSISRR